MEHFLHYLWVVAHYIPILGFLTSLTLLIVLIRLPRKLVVPPLNNRLTDMEARLCALEEHAGEARLRALEEHAGGVGG